MMKRTYSKLCVLLAVLVLSCSDNGVNPPTDDPDIYRIPIVVHIVHLGESVGTGTNLSEERIIGQIKTLNEDFRRKAGSRGFNTHPDGDDTRIEFVLAKTSPDGAPTNGIVRINAETYKDSIQFSNFDYYSSLSYWDPEHYLNIWTEPFPESARDLVLGVATGPQSDLPGTHLLGTGEPDHAEGVLINSIHLGSSDIGSDFNLGRTLTHEIGHYLGLLHLWGEYDCTNNDYVDDTPAMGHPYQGSCEERPAMSANYMTWSPDSVMNIFTKGQIERMHYVLENSPYRKSLLKSPGLK